MRALPQTAVHDLSASFVSGLSPAQVAALPESLFPYLWWEGLVGLTTGCSGLTRGQAAKLATRFVMMPACWGLGEVCARSMRLGTLSAMSGECWSFLGVKFVHSLNETQLEVVPGERFSWMGEDSVGGLAENCAFLSWDQVAHLEGCQMLNATCFLALVRTKKLGAVSPKCAAVLQTVIVSLITRDSVRQISDDVFESLPETLAGSLTDEACSGISPNQAQRFGKSCAGVSGSCLAALDRRTFGVLGPECTWRLNETQVSLVEASSVTEIDPYGLGALRPEVWVSLINRLGNALVVGLSAKRISRLVPSETVALVDSGVMHKVHSLCSSSVDVSASTWLHLATSGDSDTLCLTTQSVVMMPVESWQGLRNAHVKSLATSVLASAPEESIPYWSSDCVTGLSSEQVASLSPRAFARLGWLVRSLDVRVAPVISLEQVEASNPRYDWPCLLVNCMSPQARNALVCGRRSDYYVETRNTSRCQVSRNSSSSDGTRVFLEGLIFCLAVISLGCW